MNLVANEESSGTMRNRELKIRAELIRLLYAQSNAGAIASWLSALILALALWNVCSSMHLVLWIISYSVIQIPRHYYITRFRKIKVTDEHIEIWGTRFVAYTIASGLVWGIGGAALFPTESIAHQYIITVFLSGIAAAAAVVYSPLTECYLPTILAALVPYSMRYFWEGGELYSTVGGVILLFAGVLCVSGRHMRNITVESVEFRFERESLIESLRQEKSVTERLNADLLKEISRRIETEETLRHSEEIYRLLVNNANEAIVVIQDNKIKYANPRAMEITGYSEDEFLEKGLEELLSQEDRERVLDFHRKRLKNEDAPYKYECKMLTKDGQERWVESKVAMTSWEGRIAALGFVRDLTQRKEFEEKLLASLNEKEILLREVHHRVKNNLQVVISMLRLQARSLNDKDLKEILEVCQNRVQTMAYVHEKLYQSENLSKVDFADYLKRLVNLLKGAHGVNQNRVQIITDIGVIILDVGPAVHLGLVVGELITNCLKHAFPNGKQGTVLINIATIAQGGLRLTVSDNGVGLPPDLDLEEIESVGLRLVKAIASQMSGVLTVLPSDEGAIFEVVMPVDLSL